MSSIYHTEPPTQGKVLIKTSFGDIDVELWAKEAPLACRNFVQLAMEGYYDNTIVHRVIKGFMVQMGDPTGTGRGGKSIWGRPFKDEIHTRLKFNHRGQLAMANENAPNTNQSQFFITLDACEWLDKKHTIFGKVTGNTIFNVLKVGEVEVGGEGGDRPLEELKVLGIEVLWNPFDDIVPRDLGQKAPTASTSAAPEKTKNIKAVKDTKLLSFGDEEEEDDVGESSGFTVRMKSSHEAKKGKKKSSSSSSGASKGESSAAQDNKDTDGRQAVLSRYGDSTSASRDGGEGQREARKGSRWGGYVDAGVGDDTQKSSRASETNSGDPGNKSDEEEEGGGVNVEADFDRRMRAELIRQRQRELAQQQAPSTTQPGTSASSKDDTGDVLLDRNSMQTAASDGKRDNALKTAQDTYRKLKEDLMRSRRAVNVLTGADAAKYQEESAYRELVTPLEQRRQKFIKRRHEHGDRSGETMDKLRKFQETIRTAKKSGDRSSSSEAGAAAQEGSGLDGEVESYHGQVLEDDDRGGDPDAEKKELQNWFVGKLKCKRHVDDAYRGSGSGSGRGGDGKGAEGANDRVGGDGRSLDDYVVVDPRRQRVA